jgi:hypothetical protein
LYSPSNESASIGTERLSVQCQAKNLVFPLDKISVAFGCKS